MKRLLALVLVLASFLGGCASRGKLLVFPITAAQADRVLQLSLAEEFGMHNVHREAYPTPGYRVELGRSSVMAIRIPAIGRSESGDDVDGFVFQVRTSGTPPEDRSQAVFHRISRNGSDVATALPLVKTLD